VPALGARHARLLLGDADEDHPLLLFEMAQALLHYVVLALAFFKMNQVEVLGAGEMADLRDEAFGHFADLLGGSEAEAEMFADEARDPRGTGELGNVGVEVHPIDALQFHDDFLRLEFGDILGQIHGGVRLGFCSSILWRYRRLTAKIRHPRDAGAASAGHPSLLQRKQPNLENASLHLTKRCLRPGEHARLTHTSRMPARSEALPR
jgi:hypothetical protein